MLFLAEEHVTIFTPRQKRLNLGSPLWKVWFLKVTYWLVVRNNMLLGDSYPFPPNLLIPSVFSKAYLDDRRRFALRMKMAQAPQLPPFLTTNTPHQTSSEKVRTWVTATAATSEPSPATTTTRGSSQESLNKSQDEDLEYDDDLIQTIKRWEWWLKMTSCR